MTVRSNSPHRFAAAGLFIALVASALPMIATAGVFDCGSDFPAPEYPAPDAASSAEAEPLQIDELCGWTSLGTHDSVAAANPADRELNATSDSSLDLPVAAVAAAALSSTGVSIEQIIEPFAMVGPYLDNSTEMVERFQRWWDLAIDEANAMQSVAEQQRTDMQADLEALAMEEPLDIKSYGPSVLVPVLPALKPAGVKVTASSSLVGSSAMIATLEENYLSYDLSPRDAKLWSVFPVATHPFCIRAHASEFDATPMWEEFDELTVDRDANVAGQAYAHCGSADCHLDELIYQVENWIAEDSPLWAVLAPRNLGRQLATLATGSNRLAAGAAQLLASHWPESDLREPSSAGAALLARAGALEATEAAAQVAEIPAGTNLR